MKTLTQIAREVGVSVATVSYVYNDKWRENRIAPELAQRILRKIEQDRAGPNLLAQQLSTGKTRMIGLALADLTAAYNLELLAGIERVLAQEGYLTLLGHTDQGAREAAYLETFQQREVEGIILCPKTGICSELCEESRCPPIVQIDDYMPELPLDFIVSDNVAGAAALVRHLAKQGVKRLAYYGNDDDTGSTRDRHQGYLTAAKALGLRDVGNGRPLLSLDELDRYVMRKAGHRPQAVFVSSFMYFRDGVNLLTERGVSIGNELHLVGFDTPPADLLPAPVAHAVQQAQTMGERAARQLLLRIQGDHSPPLQERLMPLFRNMDAQP